MSEFESIGELPDGVIRTIEIFDQERHKLYDWVSVQAVELPRFERVQDQIQKNIYWVADKFSESALSIVETIDSREVAGRVIAENWLKDDSERVSLFSQLMTSVDFSPIERGSVMTLVNETMAEHTEQDAIIRSLHEDYHGTLATDIAWFFAGVMFRRDSAGPITDSAPINGTESGMYIEPNLAYLKALANKYGNFALRTVL